MGNYWQEFGKFYVFGKFFLVLERVFFAKQFIEFKITGTEFYMKTLNTFYKWLVLKDVFLISILFLLGGGSEFHHFILIQS